MGSIFGALKLASNRDAHILATVLYLMHLKVFRYQIVVGLLKT